MSDWATESVDLSEFSQADLVTLLYALVMGPGERAR